ncbi:peptidylprolyl isomerase fpr4 [Mortierella alpina]|uniref:FK506-binding protein n=1 Tax=Mortierella alpina TaxID=64518 RepID=A0A9P6ISC1_MORAP|nr:peptidylprolyl isomerase fpr4 [Mortierella alpina]
MILGFWGLTVFPHKTYTQIVDNSFKLTMAALDEETRPGRSSVRVSVDGRPYVLCSLIAGNVDQQPLDLVFTEGEEITISVSGDNVVHLSGNYLPEEAGADYGDTGDMYGDMDDDEEDDSEDEQGGVVVTNGNKRIAALLEDEDEDEDSEEDPDFTGEDSEEEDDDEDEDEDDTRADHDDDDEDDEDDEDDDDEDDEDEEGDNESSEDSEEDEDEEDEEAVAPIVEKAPAAAVPSAKKQKVSEEKAIPIKAKEELKKKDQPKKEEPRKETKKTLPNGLIIEDIKLGEGARAKAGKTIGMRYIGRLTNGKVFDKNTSGKPFSFKLGNKEVIQGWDIGIQGMQLGGERRLTIPAALAYGSRGAPPDIPGNATLVFEVKLIKLK